MLRLLIYMRLISIVSCTEIQQTTNGILTAILIMLSGFFSGATQCLLSLDEITIQVKLKYGNSVEQRYAKRILPLIQQHHLLLSTLLVANSLVNESLPIFLKKTITADYQAVLISVFLVVFLGEILPTAIMTGPRQLKIAYMITPTVIWLEAALYLICFPLSIILDCILGHRSKRYHLQQIRTLIELHQKDDVIDSDELKIIDSIMDLRSTSVFAKSIPVEQICYIFSDEPFCQRMIQRLKRKGYSTIPVIEDNVIIGTFKVRQLQFDSSHYGKLITQLLKLQRPLIISEEISMLELLRLFQKYKTDVAFLYNPDLSGMICLNDLFGQIADESFTDEDIHNNTIRF